jgi:hypothetical protein
MKSKRFPLQPVHWIRLSASADSRYNRKSLLCRRQIMLKERALQVQAKANTVSTPGSFGQIQDCRTVGAMIRHYVMAAACLGITACASSGPNLPEPAAKTVEPATRSEATEPDDVLGVGTIPSVPAATVEHELAIVSLQNEMVCRREMRTGSHRSVRVCRTRAEIERIEIESKEIFDDLHRSQKAFE